MRHSAAPVSVELQPDPHWRRAARIAPVLAASATLAWLIGQTLTTGVAPPADRLAPLLLRLGVATGAFGLSAWAAWRLRRMTDHTAGWLHWDGRIWSLQRDDAGVRVAIAVHVRLDLGRWLLLSCHAVERQTGTASRSTTGWIALARHRHPGAWHLLRCALYSPRPQHPPLHDH